ncbi:SUKH-3 domain-containing protein [Fodinicola feengrottensis]|uniref:SUKH-3 domain-containing protein n=1 Tax=Fodinicola feengrottensis TaxID=435914 RepID=UPI003CD0A0D6
MNLSFSDTTRALLEKAGWNPGRRADVSVLVGDMRSMGFDVSDAAVDFLGESSRNCGFCMRRVSSWANEK